MARKNFLRKNTKNNCNFPKSVLYYIRIILDKGFFAQYVKERSTVFCESRTGYHMEKSKKTKKNRKGASCLGVLLIFIMLLFAGSTVGVNLLFRGDTTPKILNRYCFYNDTEDMVSVLPKGSLVFAVEATTINPNDIVLYRSTAGMDRLARVSLVLASQYSDVVEDPVFYLTSEREMNAVTVRKSDIIGTCKQVSLELGLMVKFMRSKTGLLFLLILPCLIILLYIMALMSASKEAADDDDDDDTDLAFVKSIQEKKKLQQTAELPKIPSEEKAAAASPKQTAAKKRLTDEELAAMEEKEAAERAERIAAIRTRMENRQQTEMPDNVPLFTTEFIAKTHTMSIPKNVTAEAAAKAAQQNKTAQSAKPEEKAKTVTSGQPEKTAPKTAEKPLKKAEQPEVKQEAPKAEAEKPVETKAKAAESAEQPETRKKKKAAELRNLVASASYEDLMAFLNAEESKLDK